MKMSELCRLSETELTDICTLFREIFTAEPWNDDWSDDDQLRAYVIDIIGNRNSLALGLYENGELAGLSLGTVMHWYMGTNYYIIEFGIRPDCQGRGLGTEFLGLIEKYILDSGISCLFLQTERNMPAYDFYRKNGFDLLDGHVSLAKFLNQT